MRRVSRSFAALLGILGAPVGCAPVADPTPAIEWITTAADGFSLAVTELDRPRIEFFLESGAQGRTEVQAFFARSYQLSYTIRLFPDRASLTTWWTEVWRASGLDQGCYTIAAARKLEVTMLSPGAGRMDGCGPDGNQEGRVRAVLTHELVHVLHDQLNPALGRVNQAMPWFVEGLAVLASGQLYNDYASAVRTLVASGNAPTRLAAIWTSSSRYGIAGSVVDYLDHRIGRAALAGLLTATTEAEVLAAAGLSESDLLAGWRAAVLAGQ
jgi:hypothetical protein